MKKLFAFILTAVFALNLNAAEIVRGTTLTDGGVLYASDLHNLIDTATIGAGFYTDQQTVSSLGSGYYFLIYDPATALYRRITAQAVLYGNTNFWINNTASSTVPTYGSFLYYDPTNNYLRTINVSGLLAGNSSLVNVSNLAFVSTNGYKLSTVPALNAYDTNQAFFLFWKTNGQPFQIAQSNLETSFAASLGTNRSLRYTYNQIFRPWAVYGTNTLFTNAWGYQTNFPIVGTVFTNALISTNAATLSTNDSFPIYSTLQNTNTTVTLGALQSYLITTPTIVGITNGGAWVIGGSTSTITNRWTNSTNQKLLGLIYCGVKDGVAASVVVSNVVTGFQEARHESVSSSGTTFRDTVLQFIALPGDVFQVYTNGGAGNVRIYTNFFKGL